MGLGLGLVLGLGLGAASGTCDGKGLGFRVRLRSGSGFGIAGVRESCIIAPKGIVHHSSKATIGHCAATPTYKGLRAVLGATV